MGLLRSLDPKLVTTIIVFALTRGLLELGINLDPTLETIIAGVAASVAGYLKSNEGTILRNPPEMHDGNPDLEAIK